ncbi:MAG: hypothetical protein KDE20_12280, partial [Caldilineaceae bacterium]|nr:hypothetical protein [Caldilineaceae bacterium]
QLTTKEGAVTSSRLLEVRFVLEVLPRDDTLSSAVTMRVVDPTGEHNHKVRAEFLINPHRLWLPLVIQ